MNIVQSTTRSDVFIIVESGDQRDEYYRIVALELGLTTMSPSRLVRGSC
jgi:hypothetical protein